MKTINGFFLHLLAMTVFIIGLAVITVYGCPHGEHPDSGACAYDTDASPTDSAQWVSDEKPPKTTTGEWQTGKVQIIQLQPVMTVDDEAANAKKWDTSHGQPPKGQQ
jgi:hypothetical protein